MYFVDEGIRRLRRSPDIVSARKSFDRSCSICCNRGYQIRCDQCKLAYVFTQIEEGFKYILNQTQKESNELQKGE